MATPVDIQFARATYCSYVKLNNFPVSPTCGLVCLASFLVALFLSSERFAVSSVCGRASVSQFFAVVVWVEEEASWNGKYERGSSWIAAW